MSFTTDNARWRALTHRDPAANGKFVYSVKSTNIYCRPICAARLARRANCGFYKTPAEAEAAGFRACKRCKPEIENVENPQELAVGKACTLIERAMKEDDPKSIKLRDLAKSVGLTPRYFHKIFKDKTGLTPKEYAKAESAEAKSNSSTPPVPAEGDSGFETFDLDAFMFSDLHKFDFVPTFSSDNALALNAPQQILPEEWVTEMDLNLELPIWTRMDSPDTVASELGMEWYDHTLQPDAFTNFGTLELAPCIPNPSTVSTFDLDVAAVLGAESLPELLYGPFGGMDEL